MDREDSSLLRAQEMISMQMRCKLLNEFAIRSPSLPGPGNAFGFYEWAGAGRGEAVRRSAPTAPSLRARDMPRRTLLPPGPPQLGRSPAGQLLRTAREAVGQSPRHAACRRRVEAEDTPPGARLGLCPPAPLSPLWEWLLAAEIAKLAFGLRVHWLLTCSTVCVSDLGQGANRGDREGPVLTLTVPASP